MKISTALNLAVTALKDAGVDTPALDAKILLEQATGKTRAQIISHNEYELNRDEEAVFNILLQKRQSRIPVSQILGHKEFYGRDFVVDNNVLIPRPETELIIDVAKELFSAEDNFNILDLGTGSGCILLTLLKEFPQAKGTGADISKKAIAIAEKNRYNLGVDSAEFVYSDWLETVKTGMNFELVVSNPPYISLSESKSLDKELDFEPDTALFAAENGLECYRKIAESLNKVNFKYLILEIGMNQENDVIEIFEKHNIKFLKYYKDLNQIIRTLTFTS